MKNVHNAIGKIYDANEWNSLFRMTRNVVDADGKYVRLEQFQSYK